MGAVVEFDFEDVLPTVQRAHSRANRDDAEEAVQVAVAELLEKGKPLIASYVVQGARARLMNALRRRERGNLSLDAFAEDTEDQPPIELAIEEVDFESHVTLSDEVTEARSRALEAGCRSSKGWTPETILIALRHSARVHGHPPAYRDLIVDPMLPHGSTIRRYYGTLNQALKAAGLGERKGLIERGPWTVEEASQTLRAWVADYGRLPTAVDLRNATAIGLPAQMVFYRLFGSCSQAAIGAAVWGEDAGRILAAVAILRSRGPGQNEDLAAQLAEFVG